MFGDFGRFLREDAANEDLDKNEASTSISVDTRSKTWEDRLAEKYYENLYREFALCDLKHYKSGNVRFIGLVCTKFEYSSPPLTLISIVCSSLAYRIRSSVRRR